MGAVDKKSSQLRKRDKRSAYGTTILNWGLRPQTPKKWETTAPSKIADLFLVTDGNDQSRFPCITV